jgi:hypothetical protein
MIKIFQFISGYLLTKTGILINQQHKYNTSSLQNVHFFTVSVYHILPSLILYFPESSSTHHLTEYHISYLQTAHKLRTVNEPPFKTVQNPRCRLINTYPDCYNSKSTDCSKIKSRNYYPSKDYKPVSIYGLNYPSI